MEVLRLWWRELDPTQSLQAPASDFSELMVRKGIVSKSHETTRMIKLVIGDKVEQGGSVWHSQFMRLFSKVLLRAALTNVYYYIKKTANRDGTDTVPTDPAAASGKAGEERPTLRREEASHILYVLKL